MTWLAYSVDSTTGADKTALPVSDFTWARALSAGADGRCVVPLDQLTEFTVQQKRDLTRHWQRTIVLEYFGVVVFAGLVRAFERDTRTLTLYLTDLWGLWARRGAWDHNAEIMAEWSVTHSDMSLGTLAKRAVQRGTNGPPLPVIDVPLSLPADVSGLLERTYEGFRSEFVGDVLTDLMDEGLNIDFRPRWSGGSFEWIMRNDPDTNLWEWHVNAPKGGVSNFREESDGSRITNNARFIGEGSDVDTLARSQRNADSDYPLLDRVDSRKHIGNADQLSKLAGAANIQYGYPTVQYTFEVVASGDPSVSDLLLGDTARLWFDGDLWNTDGAHDRIITRLSGSLGERVTVTCQTTGGA